ncbi:protein zer-1 homolog [Teleopsis dalmanni]|uniref:protein zer-1 homolog n=1 Tax=Teleopsis dalmanni TaxID=139649 RepID=UPI0018CCE4A4|nr:protein zer-1 homolog [Teleopsis dalmanni]
MKEPKNKIEIFLEMSGKVRLKANGILDEDPLTLQEIVYKYICKYLDVISYRSEKDQVRRLYDDIVIPNDICDRLLDAYQRFNRHIDDSLVHLFEDPNRTSLQMVNLRNSTITSKGKYC